MKKTIAMAALALAVSFGSISCKKKVSDADLQTQATTIVTSNPNASVEVKDGQAHLSGTFADQASKDQMIASLKAIPGIKDVHDMSTVEAPVVETVSAVDPAVQQSVADAVKDFPSVKVEVVNGELTLTGNVSPEQARKIKMSVDALKAGKVNYNYTVK
ncbi:MULTISPECIES: BON domain-containing protein [unclassified Kaistella]|uniref:BON domain-containing protein n=1 Tax=unclassified Kaistella TaxID=2762626 RepID=UPI00273501EC|nr:MULTISPECIES: BON domain-containing protein [unclassified Kaistella]MCZ2084865.1 BON domain-containing protein [Flavobacteriales bacterium]MDP2452619.1 BON domain-containing protein [Kaistella sp. SH11-4b]MDP2455527.1 BON domain-containing protein [Kaistella sp. SH40-3]MDP2458431.1 BON domain-containing protein [Kaistella sp. SH19-2b]